MTYAEILKNLREFETTRFRSDPEMTETLLVSMYDALVALLQKLSENEK